MENQQPDYGKEIKYKPIFDSESPNLSGVVPDRTLPEPVMPATIESYGIDDPNKKVEGTFRSLVLPTLETSEPKAPVTIESHGIDDPNKRVEGVFRPLNLPKPTEEAPVVETNKNPGGYPITPNGPVVGSRL